VRFVVTAGPTREPIDPIRYLSNRSSGKMGYAVAEAALEAGHDAILISGPVSLQPPPGAKLIPVLTSDEMFEAVTKYSVSCDVLVMAAAVADYKPVESSTRKIKKDNVPLLLELIPTRDILIEVAKPNRNFLVVGFAAETENLEQNAAKKLLEKSLDLIVANDVSDPNIGMESDENEVTILFRNGEKKKLLRTSKKNIARELVKIFANLCEKSLTKKM